MIELHSEVPRNIHWESDFHSKLKSCDIPNRLGHRSLRVSQVETNSGHHNDSEKEYNRELKAVYFDLFGQTNIPGHNIHYPKFDPVLYNKRRNSKYKPYRIQLCMINPVKMQDKKVWIIYVESRHSGYNIQDLIWEGVNYSVFCTSLIYSRFIRA